MRQTRPVLSISQGSKSLGERREPVHGCYLMASVHETCKFSALCASRRKLNEPLTVRLPLSRLSLLGGPVMKHTITTIGYEGSTIGDFVAALRHASINVLIDVRELPLSRKKGFSKNQLAEDSGRVRYRICSFAWTRRSQRRSHCRAGWQLSPFRGNLLSPHAD